MNNGSALTALVVLAVGLGLYFLPATLAIARHHRNALAIGVLDLLTGWTLIGWVVALVWSLKVAE